MSNCFQFGKLVPLLVGGGHHHGGRGQHGQEGEETASVWIGSVQQEEAGTKPDQVLCQPEELCRD